MSLDVRLTVNGENSADISRIFIREGGQNKEISRDEWDDRFPNREPFTTCHYRPGEVYSANITHNLGLMAKEAGISYHLWRPEEIGITKAAELVGPLMWGLAKMIINPERFKVFNPENGWGSYETLVSFTRGYLNACAANLDAQVSVSR